MTDWNENTFTSSNLNSSFSQEDLKKIKELLNEASGIFLREIIITSLVADDGCEKYTIDLDLYLLIGKGFYNTLLKYTAKLEYSITLPLTASWIPIYESDEKAQDIINKSKDSLEQTMTRFRLMTSMNFGMPFRYFKDINGNSSTT